VEEEIRKIGLCQDDLWIG